MMKWLVDRALVGQASCLSAFRVMPVANRRYSRLSVGDTSCAFGVKFLIVILGLVVPPVLVAGSPALRPEELLPPDTVAFVSAPEVSKLSAAWKASAQGRLVADPAMKPFTDNLLGKVKASLLKPLEGELGVSLADYASMVKGQMTVAVLLKGWPTQTNGTPGILLLADAGTNRLLLQAKLNWQRKKWQESGKAVRVETVQGVECVRVPIAATALPGSALKSLAPRSPTGPAPTPAAAATVPEKAELVFAQVDSFLVLGDSSNTVDRVLARFRGIPVPALADSPLYKNDHGNGALANAPLYGWLNLQPFKATIATKLGAANPNGEVAQAVDLQKIPAALGLNKLQALTFNFEPSVEGTTLQLSLRMLEPDRAGPVKILSESPFQNGIPAFIPTGTFRMQRWRVDCRSGWATLENALSELSPRFPSLFNFLIDSANAYARQKEPGFDLRTNLFGNLGNDVILCRKAPGAGGAAAPGLLLVGSPNAEQLANSLKGVLIFLSEQVGTPPSEREFLGRKIFSLPLSASLLALAPGSPAAPTLHYAASNGYVGLSTSADIVEEFLRTCQAQPKPLRELPGIAGALERVGGTNSTLAGYEDLSESMRQLFNSFHHEPGIIAGTNSIEQRAAALLPGSAAVAERAANVAKSIHVSSLPPFEQMARYFSFMVYAGSANAEGMTLKLFLPTPAGIK